MAKCNAKKVETVYTVELTEREFVALYSTLNNMEGYERHRIFSRFGCGTGPAYEENKDVLSDIIEALQNVSA